ncbi:MAG: TPM domain-containing protein [Clostridiales bacterium]|nr:TPM domain-containing protein [Clostridiales bacterium]
MKKKIFALLISSILIIAFAVPSFALDFDESLPRIVDDADIFTASEESILNTYVLECREKYETDVVIATVTTMNGKDIDSFTDDYFDYGGTGRDGNHSYGIGTNYDGIILVICMEPDNHKVGISSCGKEEDRFIPGYVEYMYKEIGPYLSDGKYYDGAKQFIDMSMDAFEGNAKYNKLYDKYNYASDGDYSYSGTENIKLIVKQYGAALVAGLIIALVIANMLKNQMKPVKIATTAKNYLIANSLNVFYCNEMFIRSDVTKTPKPKSNSSGGSHTGSSGRSHGGGGGRSF